MGRETFVKLVQDGPVCQGPVIVLMREVATSIQLSDEGVPPRHEPFEGQAQVRPPGGHGEHGIQYLLIVRLER